MKVSAITERVSEILQDNDADAPNITWTVAELIAWLNDAMRALAILRPDATAVTASIVLATGTKQTLSAANDLRLMRVVRNMGADGNTPGKVINLVDRQILDRFNPDWHTETGKSVIKEYMYDEARPKEFWVYPPKLSTATVYVEVVKSVLPTEVAATTDDLTVDAIYAPALIEWVCYRAFSRDSEETPSFARSARHFTAFFNLLQVKMQADMAINPKVRELVKQA